MKREDKDLSVMILSIFLVVMLAVFTTLSILPMVDARTTINVSTLAQNGAIKNNGNNTNFTSTLFVTCRTTFPDITNMTVWYNSSSGGRGAPLPNARAPATTFRNTSSLAKINQTVFNGSITITNATLYPESNTYAFWCQPQNQTLSYKANSTATSGITIDRTAPTVTLKAYTNATAKKNTAQLTLNITVSDITSKLRDAARCFLHFNATSVGKNQTIGITKKNSTFGWCYSAAVNLTGQPDGNKIILVYMNDSANALRLNNTRYVRIDTTAPSATASCTPASVVKGSIVKCGCTATDATSGVSTQTADSTPSTNEAGTFSYTCDVTDVAGNTASHKITYTVTGSAGSASSSSGGGSSAGTATSVRENTFGKVTPGEVSIIRDFASDVGVKQIEIEVNNEAQNVKVTISKYDGKPAEVSVEKSGKVYQYLQIEAKNLEDKLSKATVQFRVEKSKVSNKDNVIVSKFDEDSETWNDLTTAYASEDDTYHYYDVELDGFSYFAISEQAAVAEEEEDTSGGLFGGGGDDEGRNLWWLWALIVVVILVAIGFGVRKRNQ